MVSNQKTKGQDKACMNQMMQVIQCMSKFDQNEAMCGNEIQSFRQCFKAFKGYTPILLTPITPK